VGRKKAISPASKTREQGVAERWDGPVYCGWSDGYVQHSVHPGPEISVPGANGERKLDAFVFFRDFGKDNIKYIKLRSFDYKIDCEKPYAISFSTPTFVRKGCNYWIWLG
jgi:hypothetical protein